MVYVSTVSDVVTRATYYALRNGGLTMRVTPAYMKLDDSYLHAGKSVVYLVYEIRRLPP